ncbi:replicative DNA helicase [Desulfurispirillum indicum]|uniref:Replicative DNA helicase n=1 Tax=Desulfurispirillum indicum (strain ATCC BAA-1389 / DSM 22839 / S5) TaxID=653733 RepID=E6W4V9_DESIS|nr:replicative DNA helicase [Desulfurispirillum indicum]ADU64837.1 replicative DNA helicase [Desulfurispirillum indicum S5]UCZ58033.1 replicative DNA helicase [Desulfurispirillum indicum]
MEIQQRSAIKIPPHNTESEHAVLGACIVDDKAMAKVVEVLGAEDFYLEAHRHIFTALTDLFNHGQAIDYITLSDQLSKRKQLEYCGGLEYLVNLAGRVVTSANVVHYARIVKEKSVCRQLIEAGTDIVEKGYDGEQDSEYLLDYAESKVYQISQGRAKKGFHHIYDITKAAYMRIEELYEKKSKVTGVTTGYHDLDDKTSGLQPSDLIIIAGRPAMGKTAFALSLTQNATSIGKHKVAIFSLEMSKEQLVMRLLCAEAQVNSNRVRTGQLERDDWPRLAQATGSLSNLEIYIDDTPGISVLEIRAKARRLANEKGLDMIIVDYLQLVGGTIKESREQQISEISRSLKGLAKELNVPVIALSQLNRSVEQRQDKRPMPSDLRESGAIEQDADIIMFIYRDVVYHSDTPEPNVAEIIIAKQRNGPTGTVKLLFREELTRFENLAKGYQQDGY